MIDFNVDSNGTNLSVHFPTSISEIDFNYLNDLVANVAIAPNYSLVACVFKEKPITIISQMKQGKNAQVAAVAYFIKSGTSDSSFVNNIALGTPIISAPSDLMIGHQVGVADNPLTPIKLTEYASSSSALYTKLMSVLNPVYFVSFKLIPNNVIHGAYLNNVDKEFTVKNPYVEEEA